MVVFQKFYVKKVEQKFSVSLKPEILDILKRLFGISISNKIS